MAIEFNGSTQYLSSSNNEIGQDPPFSVGAGVNIDDVSGDDRCLFWSGKTSVTNQYFRAHAQVTDGLIEATARNTTSQDASTSAGISTNTDQMVQFNYASATDRRAYIENGSSGSNTNSVTGINAVTDGFAIGEMHDSSPGERFDGEIWEWALYLADISAGERQALTDNWSPLAFRAETLKLYYPLGGIFGDNAYNLMNGTALTATASPGYTAHRAVIYPCDNELVVPNTAPVTVSPGVGAITAAGQVPTVSITNNVTAQPPAGTMAVAGQVPTATATANIFVAVPFGSITAAGQAPIVTATANIFVQVPPGSLTLSGQVPTINTTQNVLVKPGAGSITLAGLVPVAAVSGDVVVTVPVGAMTISGSAPTILTPRTINIPNATLNITGQVPGILTPVNVAIPFGSITLSGNIPQAILTNNKLITVPLGSMVVTGFQPIAGQSALTSPGVGIISLTGFVPVVYGAHIFDHLECAITLNPAIGASITLNPAIDGAIKADPAIDGDITIN